MTSPYGGLRDGELRDGGLPGAGLADLRPVLAEEQRHPLVFATVSGAHLYGFPSRDSDVDLRGVHLLPAADLVGLRPPEETRSRMWLREGVELDLVTHDLRKFVRLLLRRNGYVLEQLLSPLVVHSTPTHQQLIALAPAVVTRHHAHHYRGFARTQWRLYEKSGELKPLLYTYRVLLTGIHLMRGGRLQAHLPTLLQEVPEAPAGLSELIAAKAEAEHLPAADLGDAAGLAEPETARAEVERLHALLDEAQESSRLPTETSAFDALHDLVVGARGASGA